MQKLNTLIHDTNNDTLIKLLDLNLDKVLSAARDAECLGTIFKNILIEIDQNRLNKGVLSRKEWQSMLFEDRIEEAFLKQKSILEKVSFWYWVVDTKEEAMEYYYQLCNDETTFSDLKNKHPEIIYYSDYLVSQLDASLSKAISYARLNVPMKPFRTKKGYLILKKDSFKSANLNNELKVDLLEQLEDEWCLRELKNLIEET